MEKIKGFVKNHKKAFIIGAVVVGGVTAGIVIYALGTKTNLLGDAAEVAIEAGEEVIGAAAEVI